MCPEAPRARTRTRARGSRAHLIVVARLLLQHFQPHLARECLEAHGRDKPCGTAGSRHCARVIVQDAELCRRRLADGAAPRHGGEACGSSRRSAAATGVAAGCCDPADENGFGGQADSRCHATRRWRRGWRTTRMRMTVVWRRRFQRVQRALRRSRLAAALAEAGNPTANHCATPGGRWQWQRAWLLCRVASHLSVPWQRGNGVGGQMRPRPQRHSQVGTTISPQPQPQANSDSGAPCDRMWPPRTPRAHAND